MRLQRLLFIYLVAMELETSFRAWNSWRMTQRAAKKKECPRKPQTPNRTDQVDGFNQAAQRRMNKVLLMWDDWRLADIVSPDAGHRELLRTVGLPNVEGDVSNKTETQGSSAFNTREM